MTKAVRHLRKSEGERGFDPFKGDFCSNPIEVTDFVIDTSILFWL
jgi:hypothetical protein